MTLNLTFAQEAQIRDEIGEAIRQEERAKFHSNLFISDWRQNKIQCIKRMRENFGISLKDAVYLTNLLFLISDHKNNAGIVTEYTVETLRKVVASVKAFLETE